MDFYYSREYGSIIKRTKSGKEYKISFSEAVKLNQQLEDSITDIQQHAKELLDQEIENDVVREVKNFFNKTRNWVRKKI